MKRTGNLFDRIVDETNLEQALAKALRGKRAKRDAQAFTAQAEFRLQHLAEELRAGTIRLGEATRFTIFDPKERIITAPCFRERVLHHAIINVCEPEFERFLIDDSYACRRGKGRTAALLKAQTYAQRHDGFLKIDMRKYFDSICHETLGRLLRRKFKDKRLLDLFERIIASHHATEANRGLPIGSLTSQHFANFYLGWFDHFVKRQLRAPSYVRYMDDCLVWADSTQGLSEQLKPIREFLATELRLELKPHPYINHSRHGVDFLGCRVYPTHIVLNRASKARFVRKLRALEQDHAQGRIDEDALQQRATALVAFTRTSGVRSWRFRRSVINFAW